MPKLYRVVSYVLDLNYNHPSVQSVVQTIECNRHPEFHSVKDVSVTDVGEWSDDHELNQGGADFQKYFPETALKEIENKMILLLNLNAVTTDEDTVQQVKDENWTALKIILKNLKTVTGSK